GKMSGTFGEFGVFSFNGNKIITTSGGGALVSNDVEALKKAKFLATQARDPAVHYQHSEVGYNYRMSHIGAAIGRARLEVLDERVPQRRAAFKRYYEASADAPGIRFQRELEETRAHRWLTAWTIAPQDSGVSRHEIIE